jgi:Mrp family chromosome partitioning ATPase
MASADAGTRTLLLECDLRRPVLAARLGIASGPGLTDYLTAAATPQEIMQVVSRAPANTPRPPGQEGPPAEQSPLVCITAGTRSTRPADLLASERFREFLAEVSAVYELVIVDSAPLLSVADTLVIVPHVSAVLLCVRLRQTTREQAGATRAALRRLPPRPTGVVLTDVRDADDSYFGYYQSNVGAPAATV